MYVKEVSMVDDKTGKTPTATISIGKSPKVADAVVVEANEQERLSFLEAMAKIVEGKKVTKLEWYDQDHEYYAVFRGGFLMYHKPDGKDYQWVISDGDIAGTDYIVIN